jgi:hypothetical protein
MTIIAAALAVYACTMERAFEARSQTIGASEIGRCARQLYYAKNEGDPARGARRNPDHADQWRGAAARGTIFERHFWGPALHAAYGDRLLFAGEQQQTFVQGFLSATPDGLLVGLADDALAYLGVASLGGDRSILLECKSVHPNTRLAEPKLAHAYQLQVGLGLIRARTTHRPEFALLSYTNASDWADTREFAIERDAAVFAVARARALKILTATFAEALPPEGQTAGGKECGWCPFSHACLGAPRPSIPESKQATVTVGE